MSGQEIRELTDVFREIDTDDTGMVTIKELREAMVKSKIEITQEELDDIFSLLDETQESEKRISYTNFIKATLDTRKILTKEKLQSLFKQFDSSQNNSITEQDLLEIMRRHGQVATEEEVRNMIKEVDSKNEGKITFEVFKKLMNEDNIPIAEDAHH